MNFRKLNGGMGKVWVFKKATKFEKKIFVVLLTRALCSVRATAHLSKSQRRFFNTNVVKSYYTNFTHTIDMRQNYLEPSSTWLTLLLVLRKSRVKQNSC